MMSKFIVLEGIDGSGKSSVIRSIKEENSDYHYTQEPTDSEPGKLAKEAADRKHSPYLDLFLYLADRVQHTEQIEEILKKGKPVICDRYWGSTSAYQAATKEIDLKFTESIQMPFILEPDLTILFDVSPEISLKRISSRESKSKYEHLDFLKRVRHNYLQLAKKYDWEIIDAGKDPKEVLSEVREMVFREVRGVQ